MGDLASYIDSGSFGMFTAVLLNELTDLCLKKKQDISANSAF